MNKGKGRPRMYSDNTEKQQEYRKKVGERRVTFVLSEKALKIVKDEMEKGLSKTKAINNLIERSG